MLKVSNRLTHVYVGYANPYLVCTLCKQRVTYWHNPGRCGCDNGIFNYPCEHKAAVISICSSWSSVDGCKCVNKETHDE